MREKGKLSCGRLTKRSTHSFRDESFKYVRFSSFACSGRCIPFKGNYSEWLEAKQRRLELESKQDASRNKVLEKELEWIRQAPKGRMAKSKVSKDKSREEKRSEKRYNM